MKATDAISYQMDSTGIKIQIDADTHQTFTNDNIKIQATSNVWQIFNSSGMRLQSTDSVYQEFDSTSIVLASGKTSNTASEVSAYTGGSKITINDTKVSITGIPKAPTFDMADYRTAPGEQGNYRNMPPLGYPPRQRMVIEDPVSGEAQLGMAVYYLDLTKVNVTLTSGPADSMGVQGDLAVMF
jgi:hypothetical protein